MNNTMVILGVLVLAALPVLSGCGGSSAGTAIPEGMEVTSLSSVLEDPGSLKDRKVLLSGAIEAICPSLCDLVLRDGKETIVVFPAGFKLPDVKKGLKIRVYGEVMKGEEQVFVSALGVEVIRKRG